MLVPFDPDQAEATSDKLRRYLHEQSPEDLAKIAQAVSPEVKQMIAQNVQGLLGNLPSEQFNIQITTHRDQMAGLLASAMMTGYFLSKVEQRMLLEKALVEP